MKERYKEIIEEVIDEIETAIRDSGGLIKHQRRLAFSLSLGAATLIEVYLDDKNVLKSGSKVNHLWLNKKKENVKKFISNQIIGSLDNLEKLDALLEIAYKIESERNKLAYGKSVSEEILKEQINLFFKLKKEIENV